MSPDAPARRPRGGQLAEIVSLLRRAPDFRKLFLASVVSFLGDWFALVAVSGLVKDITGREGATALVFAAEVLPVFLVAPFAGVLADRWDRKKILVFASGFAAVPSLLLVVASTQRLAWLAYLGVVLISVLAGFFQPIVSAIVPNMVDEEDLSLAQTVIGSVWGTMLFVGAAVGGLVAAALGREASFVINAATFLLAATFVIRIRRPFTVGEVRATASVLAQFREVWGFVRPRKPTRAFMVTKAGVGVGNGIVGLLPVYAVDVFGGTDAAIGFLLAARGAGALVGPYVGRAIAGDRGQRLVFVTGASIVAYAVAYTLLPSTETLAVGIVVVALAHAGGGNQWVMSTHGLQLSTPDSFRGRIMSFDFAIATLAIGTSALLAGAAAEAFGLIATSYGLAALSLAYGILWLAWTRDLWAADEDPLRRAEVTPVSER